jgi:hypothetical protein
LLGYFFPLILQKWVGQHFGATFFHTLIWSPCTPDLTLRRKLPAYLPTYVHEKTDGTSYTCSYILSIARVFSSFSAHEIIFTQTKKV